MKRLFIIFYSAVALIACDKNHNMQQLQEQNPYATILDGVNNLNNQFGCSNEVTRASNGRDGVKAGADIAGGVVGHYFGTDIGAAVGSMGGVPGAIIGGFIGKKFGQMIGVAVASFVAGVVYDMFTSSTNAEVLIPIQDVIESVDPYLWTDGEIHNAILCQLTNNLTRQNTRSGELELTISQIFDEAIKYSQELINEPIEIDPKFREYMESFCEEVECSMLKRGCNVVDFSVIFTDYLSSQNIEVADDLGLIYNNLLNSSSLDNKLLSEYEISYLKMIDHSALSNEDKALLSTTGSVAIRSGQFWHNR